MRLKTKFRTYRTHAQARAKQVEYEKKTGVKWSFYSTGDGMIFNPVITRSTPRSERAAEKLLPHLTRGGAGFMKLSEKSGMRLKEVLSGAKTLVKKGMATPGVNRVGLFSSVRLRDLRDTRRSIGYQL